MSLSSTLADFTLSEFLQLTALTGKTGVLEVRAQGARSWIGIREGAVVRVARSERALEEEAGAEPEAFAVEFLLELLDLTEGEFTLETGVDPRAQWPGPDGISLVEPLSIQFLALEAIRVTEEDERAAAAAEARRSAELVGDALAEAPTCTESPAARSARPPSPRPAAVIVVDRDLALIERIKQGLAPSGVPVHILQNPADGLIRLRQYLRRAEIPAIVLGKEVADPIEPRRKPGWAVFARRVRALAPGMRIVLLSADATNADTDVSAVVRTPTASDLITGDTREFLDTIADALGLRA